MGSHIIRTISVIDAFWTPSVTRKSSMLDRRRKSRCKQDLPKRKRKRRKRGNRRPPLKKELLGGVSVSRRIPRFCEAQPPPSRNFEGLCRTFNQRCFLR